MTDLFLHGREVNTVFDLLGDKENDITFSVGWALAQSSSFRDRFVRDVLGNHNVGETLAIRLQEFVGEGYTDIVVVAERAHVIVEAKRGWTLPGKTQLAKYARHFERGISRKAIVVLAECTPEYADSRLPRRVKSIPVLYRSWKHVARLAGPGSGTHVEKRLLHDLRAYLEGLMSMQNQESNLVYVLALSSEVADWSELSWIEYVTKKRRYFHPYASGWPKEPPNYLGFRYRGGLRSIHHVEDYAIVADLSKHLPEIDARKWNAVRRWDAYMLYRLGPPILPPREVKTGNIYRNGRVWAALDLLLTCKTISEARDLTKKRLGKEVA